jgi:penicillin amidase
MIVGWSGPGRPVGEGIYPGGQSENPASPWYANLVGDWWNGRYLPMPWLPGGGAPASASAAAASSASAGGDAVSWELRP